MDQDGRYQFPAEQRHTLEALPIALAAYQFVNNTVVTLLVSDGLCHLYGRPRAELTCVLDNDMFGSVHPDDVEMLANLGYTFATKEGLYDVVYRTRISGGIDYHMVHVIGKFRSMENGAHVAFLTYVDVTDTRLHQMELFHLIESPKSRFLDENMSAMAIVSRENKRLLYYNKALLRLLPPKCNFDSNITFDRFFLGGGEMGGSALFHSVDIGPSVIHIPQTNQTLEINVLSSTYNDEPAFVAYFYDCPSASEPTDAETLLRHKRAAFHAAIFTGESNGLPYYDSGYRGFRVWNLTQNSLAFSAGCDLLLAPCGASPSFDSCAAHMQQLCVDSAKIAMIAEHSAERLIALFEGGSYPRSIKVRLQSSYGMLHFLITLTMLRSPDSGDVFLKIEERNETDEAILKTLIEKIVSKEYDFIAYSDLSADRCHIVTGSTAAGDNRFYTIRTSDHIHSPADIRTFPAQFPRDVHSIEDMSRFLISVCDADGFYTSLQELPDGSIKNVEFQLIDPVHRTFCIRCKDVTDLLRCERARKKELELAVQTEHEKVERVLLQTILSISNALDARDPLTRRHSQRVAEYSAEIARRLNWPEERVLNLYNVALVHDIGKIGIPDALLQKCGKLTDEEYLQIQDHVAIGSFILKDFTAIDKVAEGALFHHERYNGTGYPRGLSGEKIPIEARIIGIADAVDAMNSTRPYRARQNELYIRGELAVERGRQFDPALVDIMLRMIDDGVLNT